MSRDVLRKGFGLSALLLATLGGLRSAEACSLVWSGPGAWSPQPNGSLPLDAPLLLAGVDASARTSLLSATGERIELTREPAFGRVMIGPRYGFFAPAEPLEPNAAYVLESSDGLSVPFQTSAHTPRIQAILSLRTELKTLEPQVLSSGFCYDAPLEGREVTRYAAISATIEPWAPLILSVRAHDAESSSDFEQTLASDAVGSPDTLELELPLPSGVDDCPRVRVLDYAGQTLLDVPQLCLTENSAGLTQSVEVFEPPKDRAGAEAEPGAEAGSAPRDSASEGCALAASKSDRGFSLMLVVGLLIRRCRRRRIEKPSGV